MTARRFRSIVPVLALLLVAARQAPAVSGEDIAGLEASADDAARLTAALRKTDPVLAADLDKKLADLRDDVTYLKVKLRRDGSVTRAEYLDVRDLIDALRLKAQGQKVTAQPLLPADAAPAPGRRVPAGARLDVRLQTALNSGTTKLDARFDAATILDYRIGEETVIPAGTLLHGFVSSVRASTSGDHQGSLTLSFDELVIGEEHRRLRASVEQVIDGHLSRDAERAGMSSAAAAAAVAASAGGLIGGQEALPGVLVAAAGTIASIEGANVDLPPGTILRIRLDQPVDRAPRSAGAAFISR